MEQRMTENENRTRRRAWFRRHKKGLIIGGCTLVACIVGGVIIYKNKEVIMDGLEHLLAPKRAAAPTKRLPTSPVIVPIESSVEVSLKRDYNFHIDSFDVRSHMRRGRNGQLVYVKSYTKHPNAA